MPRTFGIDARAAAEVPAGRGRVLREVLRALAQTDGDDRWILYCREPWTEIELDGRFEWRQIGLPDPAWHLAAARAATKECDAFASTNSYLTAWFTGVPTAVIVYDLVPFIPGAQAQKRAAQIERATIDIGVRRARALLCISDATRHDLIERVPQARSRAVVWPLAADARFDAQTARPRAAAAAEAHGIDKPYVLAVGTLEPRKNLERLLEAWEGLGARGGHELVLVGPKGWEAEQILASAKSGGVRTLGFVSDDDLTALYAGASVFAYPSLYEGFGLPVLEAMQSGVPVLTSNVSSLPEVAEGAALLVDPLDVHAIRDGLATLLADPARRAELAEAGLRRARDFSWERTAEGLRDALAAIAR